MTHGSMFDAQMFSTFMGTSKYAGRKSFPKGNIPDMILHATLLASKEKSGVGEVSLTLQVFFCFSRMRFAIVQPLQ